MAESFTPPDIKELVLQRFPLGVHMRLTERLIKSARFSQVFDLSTRQLTASIEAYITASTVHISKTLICEVPLTWYDHFKSAVFPSFLLRIFPLRQRKIYGHITLQHLCPHLDLDRSEEQRHYDFLTPSEAVRIQQLVEEANMQYDLNEENPVA